MTHRPWRQQVTRYAVRWRDAVDMDLAMDMGTAHRGDRIDMTMDIDMVHTEATA